jgi:putative protein-disulfide isomerase
MIDLGTKNGQTSSQQADLLQIVYYTDPLCCWSWGFEPQWRKFLYEYAGQLDVRYCMGGLLPGWNNFHDSVNAVSKPIQMGPVWMHAVQLSGMPMPQNIWVTDPPASSYPACIAVKAAELQSSGAGEGYLRMLREELMIGGRNISKQAVLIAVAERLAAFEPAFNRELFIDDLDNGRGKEAFRKDLQEVQYHRINRFPSLVVRNPQGKAILIEGYRQYDTLVAAVQQVYDLKKTGPEIDPEVYRSFWPTLTARELREVSPAGD